MFDRKLLAKLSRCAWKVLSAYLKQSVPFDDAVPGAAIAVHTFGDFVQYNPHLHLIATDGCFSGGGTFGKGPEPVAKDLEELFRYQVLKMLKVEGKINDAVIENMLSWRHGGFNIPNKGESRRRRECDTTATTRTNHAECAKRPVAMIRCRLWSNRPCLVRRFAGTGLG